MNLKPLKKIPKPKPFSVFDIESQGWTKFLVVGHFDGHVIKHFRTLNSFLDYCFSHDDSRLFAHFGGIFDFQFVIEAAVRYGYAPFNILPRGSGLLSFDLRDRVDRSQRVIQFADSSALLPIGLRDLSHSFGVKYPKLDWDHSKTNGVTPELLKYLDHDLRATHEVISKFYGWKLIRKSGQAITLAGQASRIFRTMLKEPLYLGTRGHDRFCRDAYFGGRTEVFRPVHRDRSRDLYLYDVNGLYPSVMRTMDVPGNVIGKSYEYSSKDLGIWDLTVHVPDQPIPPLPTKVLIGRAEKLVFPVGTMRGKWTTPEIQYALQHCGVKILKTHEGLLFDNKGRLFKKYVETLYKIRRKAQKKGDAVGDVLSKLLQNALYGRFGISLEKFSVEFDDWESPGEPIDASHYSISVGGKNYTLIKKLREIKTYSNVAIAAFITAEARIALHRYFRKAGLDVYYCDTDSLVTSKNLPTSTRLGALKLENTILGKHGACFLLPKTYCFTSKEKGKKIRMKGFPRKLTKHFDFSDFMECYQGGKMLSVEIPPSFARFKTALRNGKLVMMQSAFQKSIVSRYDKRETQWDGSDWVTKPLKVKVKNDGKSNCIAD